jgi:hypothetical protein
MSLGMGRGGEKKPGIARLFLLCTLRKALHWSWWGGCRVQFLVAARYRLGKN